MTEKRKINIVLEDDFGRVQTAIETELSAPKLMDKILEDLEMSKKRFELQSWHFNENKGRIYDNLKHKELVLSIYELISLLNEVAQSEYDFEKLGNEIKDKIDKLMELKE